MALLKANILSLFFKNPIFGLSVMLINDDEIEILTRTVLLNTNHFFLAHKLRNILSFSDHDLWPSSNPTKWLRFSCEVISLLSSALRHNKFIMSKNVPCLENQKHCFWIIHFALFPWPLAGIQKAHLSYPSLGNGSRVWIVGLELVALASR